MAQFSCLKLRRRDLLGRRSRRLPVQGRAPFDHFEHSGHADCVDAKFLQHANFGGRFGTADQLRPHTRLRVAAGLSHCPKFTRLRPVEQSRAFAFPPSHPDAKVPRAGRLSSPGALDRRFDCAASS